MADAKNISHTQDETDDIMTINEEVTEQSLLRKLDARLLPGVGILYLLSFLDRSNGTSMSRLRLDSTKMRFSWKRPHWGHGKWPSHEFDIYRSSAVETFLTFNSREPISYWAYHLFHWLCSFWGQWPITIPYGTPFDARDRFHVILSSRRQALVYGSRLWR